MIDIITVGTVGYANERIVYIRFIIASYGFPALVIAVKILQFDIQHGRLYLVQTTVSALIVKHILH